MTFALLRRLWDSPTFTSWGSKLAASARLFLVLPLILNRFDDVEIACWLIFGSVLFFGNLIAGQLSLVLSRMVSVAFGGARDLCPVEAGNVAVSDGEVNWPLIERLYGSISLLNLVSSLAASAIAAVFGWFAISPLLSGYDQSEAIWSAFIVLVIGQLIAQLFRKYAIILRGLNEVALVNRWDVVFSIISACAGAAALLCGGNIVVLAFVIQAFGLLGVWRQWFLLMWIVEPRFRRMPSCVVDSQILKWVWGPMWRSLIRAMANRGGSRVGIIVLARVLDPVSMGSFLLCLRLLDTLDDVSSTPMASHVPRFGRLLGRGDIAGFREGVTRAYRVAVVMFAVGVIGVGYGAHFILALVGSNAGFPSQGEYFTVAIAFMVTSSIRLSLTISVVGNHIVAIWRLAIAAIVSLLLSVVLIPHMQIYGFIISSFLPIILFVNINPLRHGCALMQVGWREFLGRTVFYAFCAVLAAAALSALFPWEIWSAEFAKFVGQLGGY